MRNRFTIKMFIAVLFCATIQAQTGGNFTVTQSVIAGGGTSADAGNMFSVTGAIGQSIVDASGNGAFSVKSGFFTAPAPLAPTAAAVSVSGRVLTSDGRGIRNVVLIMTDSSGAPRTTTSTEFGFYRFDNVVAGETYIITAHGKRFSFIQPTRVLNVNNDTDDVNFVGNPTQSLRNFE